MKKGFFARIAIEGIKKNRRLYLPYILSGTGLSAMTYILFFLATSPLLNEMKGGGVLEMVLPIGVAVVCLFSLIFMFYSNSFLIRQRNREFGLYNVLGMDKKNLGRVMLWENLAVFAMSLASGLICGIALSKLTELAMVNILQEEVSYTLRIDLASALKTLVVFACIFLLLLINSLVKIRRSSALELLKSSAVGERAPKANWLTAALGAVILAAAYYIALSIENPLSAILWFAVAVIMVIIATYLLFISGSVALCRALQKNKGYYYKPRHFVSVSSMVYRMKRNGAGLASICILITMVLVMLTSTISLYAGEEDTLKANYPNDINFTAFLPDMEQYTEESFESMQGKINELVGDVHNVRSYPFCDAAGLFEDGVFLTDTESHINFDISTYSTLSYLSIISLEDYNELTGESAELKDGECLISCYRCEYDGDSVQVEHCEPLAVKAQAAEIALPNYLTIQPVPIITLVVKDVVSFVEPAAGIENSFGEPIIEPCWCYGFDIDGDGDAQVAAYEKLWEGMGDIVIKNADEGYGYSLNCREEARSDFYSLYGALFFLGILLSVIFVFAAVLIIYYKQVSEGYEDQARFEVMQKVGMTKTEIRRTINSQVLTVFFAPLVLAGVHLAVAFPIIWKMLQLFMFKNMSIMVIVNIACFAVFALIYAIVYKLTSNTYYSIVSGAKS